MVLPENLFFGFSKRGLQVRIIKVLFVLMVPYHLLFQLSFQKTYCFMTISGFNLIKLINSLNFA